MKLFTAHIRDSVMSGTGRQGQGVSDRERDKGGQGEGQGVSDRENDKGAVTGRMTRGQ